MWKECKIEAVRNSKFDQEIIPRTSDMNLQAVLFVVFLFAKRSNSFKFKLVPLERNVAGFKSYFYL